MGEFYVYALLDIRKPGKFSYNEYSLDFEPFYIGKGKGNRMKDHLYDSRLSDPNKLKVNIINKIVRETGELPIIKVISENLSESQSHNLEIQLISLIGRRDLKLGSLSNLTNGGEGQSGSRLFMGENNPFFNKIHNRGSFENISISVIQLDLNGNILNTYDSINQASIYTNSNPSKISLCIRGIRNMHNNYIWRYKSKSDCKVNYKNIKDSRTKFKFIKKIDIDTNETIERFSSIREACRVLNLHHSNLIDCLKGRKNTCGGYRWEYEI